MAENDHKNYFSFLKNWLRLSGISLNQKETPIYIVYSSILLSGIFSLAVYPVHTALLKFNDYDVLIEILIYNSEFISGFLKAAAMFRVRKQIGTALERLQSGIFVQTKDRGGEEKEKLIKYCVTYMNAQGVLLCVLSLTNTCSASAGTLITRITKSNSSYWRLPFGPFFIFDASDSPNFDIVWTYQSLFVPLNCLGFCAIDAFMAGTMAYLSVQCIVLQNLIKKSVVHSHQRMMEEVQPKEQQSLLLTPAKTPWKYLKFTLREIIEYHTDIINISSELERLFNIPIIINFLGLSTTICMAVFYTTSLSTIDFRFMQQVVLAVGAIFLQFLTSYWSNQVMEESMGISAACCEIDIAGVDVRFQKGLLLIIQRSQKPIQFTVGKFAPLSLNTFLLVLKAAYSYYNVLLHGRKS